MPCRRPGSRLLRWAALALCLGGPVNLAGARAESESDRAISAACDTAGSTSEHRQCLRELLEKADRDLDAILTRLLGSSDATDAATYRNEMTTAQENWVKFRQFDCNAVFYEWGGSIRESMVLICRLRHTLDRIRTLKDHLPPDEQLYPPEYKKYFPPK